MLRSRPLSQADWLSNLIDGVWLTREICVIVAIGIDATGWKQVLDFELGPSENVTAVTAFIGGPAARGGGRWRSPLCPGTGMRRCPVSGFNDLTDIPCSCPAMFLSGKKDTRFSHKAFVES
jgi:hypothetical protein